MNVNISGACNAPSINGFTERECSHTERVRNKKWRDPRVQMSENREPQLLTEKYRPASLDAMKGNAAALECLKSFTPATMPNLLLYGPPGTGKTTAIRALLAEHPRQHILELNASDDRGIETVRQLIKEFAAIKAPVPRIVILDEVDSMSRDAQNALRRVMEDYKGARFCLICNYPRRIINPIASRCTHFRFAPVEAAGRILEVCAGEGVHCEPAAAELLASCSDGDLRKALNDLAGVLGFAGRVDTAAVREFFQLGDDTVLDDLFERLRTLPFEAALKAAEGVVAASGLDCAGLVEALAARAMRSDIDAPIQLALCTALADIELRLARGCSEAVQMRAAVAAFTKHCVSS